MARSILVVGWRHRRSTLAMLSGRAGYRATLVERDAGQRSGGSPVDVRGAAVPVVDRLAVTDDLRASETGVTCVEFLDEHGVRRARATMRRNSATDIAIRRSTLNRVLIDAATDVAELVYDDGPVHLESDRSGVDVTFDSGRRSRFDLVVGADGRHSTVRRLAFGPESEYASPLGLAVATAPVDTSLWCPRRTWCRSATCPDPACPSIPPVGTRADALAGTDDVDAAVAAYERDHRRRVTAAQRGAGYGASVLVPKSASGIGLRNLPVRVARRA